MAILRTSKTNEYLLSDDWQFQVGGEGEQIVVNELLRLLPDTYQIFFHVEIPNSQSRTGHTEIDVLVVGPTGIFCIEVKTINGIVDVKRGTDYYWNVRSHSTDEIWKIRNPARQSYSQKKTLEKWLRSQGIKNYAVKHVVVFPVRSTELNLIEDPWCPVFMGVLPLVAFCTKQKVRYDAIEIEEITTLMEILDRPEKIDENRKAEVMKKEEYEYNIHNNIYNNMLMTTFLTIVSTILALPMAMLTSGILGIHNYKFSLVLTAVYAFAAIYFILIRKPRKTGNRNTSDCSGFYNNTMDDANYRFGYKSIVDEEASNTINPLDPLYRIGEN